MSLSIPPIRLLLDENVRIELAEFLLSAGFNIKLATKGSSDRQLARLSKKEKRVVVTNDKDFAAMNSRTVLGVIWLRLPQRDVNLLISSFKKLLSECKNYPGNLVIVEPTGWKNFRLTEKKLKH